MMCRTALLALAVCALRVRCARGEKEVVTIVVWDKVRGYVNWLQDWFIKAAAENCNTRCIISERKGEVQSADVVLFHGPTHGQSSPRFPQPPVHRALYLLMSVEQPKYAKILQDKENLDKDFDVIATYSLAPVYPDTDIPNIPLTYYPLNIMSVNAVMQPSRPLAEKTGYNTGVTVALFTSNCHNAGASGRYEYLKELMALIQVHSYGKCHKNRDEPLIPDDPRWPPIAQKRARKVKILSHYKFYLAFENLPVDDYVSEKVFEALFAGAVPVYRGAAQIARFMPANDSFIDASGLSPRQLAQLLTRIGADDEAYGRYFAFKNRALSDDFQQIALMSYTHPNVLCRICDYAAENRGK